LDQPAHLGRHGEQIAGALLKSKGFTIEAVNWRAGRLGEIDLIAYHPLERMLVFVEVKTRRGNLYGEPVEAVTPRKQAQLLSLAEAFMGGQNRPELEHIRFDVVSICFPGQGRPADVTHLENAFSA
jgi:putative endonuclease